MLIEDAIEEMDVTSDTEVIHLRDIKDTCGILTCNVTLEMGFIQNETH
jgi:hypothetical protein